MASAGNIEEGDRIFDQMFVAAANTLEDTMRQMLEMQRQEIGKTAEEIAKPCSASRILPLAGISP